jgi:hypothetical protein
MALIKGLVVQQERSCFALHVCYCAHNTDIKAQTFHSPQFMFFPSILSRPDTKGKLTKCAR